ncbi:hypothetical protein [uncultured Bacteroides sp.]|uniref:hypothetical protein n=1 Tax=uncultured Bacteroides sp. TaxID=162156 RepID=UPI0025D247E0|nr:hypothetical protein [uncultured Bacteroides sp.]
MKKYSFHIVLVLMSLLAGACYDYNDVTHEIGEASDQAFISNMNVYDKDMKSVLVSKNIPATKVDADGIERFKEADTAPEIELTVKPESDLSQLILTATLSSQSSYAKISPVMGKLMDFSTPQEFTVTSQSGKNVLKYKVTIKTE